MPLADAQAIGLLTGRRPGTIRSWASRGQLKRRGRDGRRVLYDTEEAEELAKEIGPVLDKGQEHRNS